MTTHSNVMRGEQVSDALQDHRFVKWMSHAERLAMFTRGHAQLLTRSRKDPEEFALGEWLKKQCVHQRAGRLAAERVQWLNENAPGWMGVSFDDQFQRSARRVAAFVSETGEFPRRSSTGPNERTLNGALATTSSGREARREPGTRWLDNVRQAAREDYKGTAKLNRERKDLLDALIPGTLDATPIQVHGKKGAPWSRKTPTTRLG